LSAKSALITGITGQDGSYLAELLLTKGYTVYGIQRRTSTITTERIDHMLEPGTIETFYADLADANSLVALLTRLKPDEVYNLGSMSHVRVSFEVPEYTAQVTGVGPLRILEALRMLGMTGTKFYQASSSEMWGLSPAPQSEDTPMLPVSPYGCAKLFAYHITRSYRFGYGMFACNGILHNHESPRRGITFVTQKIVHGACKIKLGLEREIRLGNLDALRDWGYAGDYVRAIFLIMQYHKPDDFIVATSEQHTVRDFAEKVFKRLALNLYEHLVADDRYRRPNEVPSLMGDFTKVRTVLGWEPEVGYDQLIDMMLEAAMVKEKAKWVTSPGYHLKA